MVVRSPRAVTPAMIAFVQEVQYNGQTPWYVTLSITLVQFVIAPFFRKWAGRSQARLRKRIEKLGSESKGDRMSVWSPTRRSAAATSLRLVAGAFDGFGY